MPVTIKKSQLMYKNPSTGEYVSVDAVADKTSQQQINGINTAASNAIASINTAMQDIDTQPLTTLPKKAYKKDLVANEETLASAATHAYAVGDYFFVADNNNDISLYKATAAIAVGATISPGTGIDNNCIPAALADDVTSLSNDIDTVKADLSDLDKATNVDVFANVTAFTIGKMINATQSSVGQDWTTLVSDNGSSVYLSNAIDLTGHLGDNLILKVNGRGSTSTRAMGFCNANGIISSVFLEKDLEYIASGDDYYVTLPITDTHFFFSFSRKGSYESRDISITGSVDAFAKRVKRVINKNGVFPVAFSWQDNPINDRIAYTADGYTTDFDASELKPNTGVVYYVAPNGNDSNDGLSPQTPLQKLSTALAKADVNTIICADGFYNVYRVGGNISKGVNIIAANNARPCFVMSYANAWGLASGYDNVYMCNGGSTTIYGVVHASEKDTDGDYLYYTRVNSISDVSATPNSYFVDGSTVYAWHDGQPSRLYPLIGGSNLYATLSNGETLYIEGCDFIGGNYGSVRVANGGSSAPLVVLKNCGFECGYAGNSLYLEGCVSVVQSCHASFAYNDGFNYHAKNGVIPKAVEISCVGRKNGKSGGNTDNGSTIHDGGKIIRLNCEYYGNAGPNVADVNDNTETCNIGVVSHNSNGTSIQGCGFQTQNGKMWNNTCSAYANTHDYYGFNSGTLLQHNSIGTPEVTGTGKMIAY